MYLKKKKKKLIKLGPSVVNYIDIVAFIELRFDKN